MLYALSIADHAIAAGAYRHVLIACSEVLSTRIDGSYDGRNISILFGDGAGAVVVGPTDDANRGNLSTILHADGSGAKVLYTEAPGSALPRKEHLVKEDIDAGRVHFRMIGKEVFENGVARMSEAIFESLEANGLTMDDIDVLIPHQANLRMLEAVIERTGFPPEKVFLNVVDHGNIASATLPIALDQARQSGMVHAGQPLPARGLRLGLRVGLGAPADVAEEREDQVRQVARCERGLRSLSRQESNPRDVLPGRICCFRAISRNW